MNAHYSPRKISNGTETTTAAEQKQQNRRFTSEVRKESYKTIGQQKIVKKRFCKSFSFPIYQAKGGESSSGYYEVLRAIFLIIIILHLLLVFLPYAAIKTRFDSNGTI